MITGHIPSGFLLGKIFLNQSGQRAATPRSILVACLLGAIAPDLDMLYFFFIDNRQHPHHSYWSHYPIVWLSALLACALWHKATQHKKRSLLALLFSLAGVIHLLLDSIAGGIWWLAPFSDTSYSLAHIPALYDPWWFNFVLHWSFVLEVILWGWAFWTWRGSAKKTIPSFD